MRPAPAAPRRRCWSLAGIAAVAVTGGSYRFGVITSMIVAIIALSLVVLTGLVGQISLAQAAFAGAAGFALSKIGTGLPFPLSLLVAALVAAGLGLLVGRPGAAHPRRPARGRDARRRRRHRAVRVPQPEAVAARRQPDPDPELFGIDLGVRDAAPTSPAGSSGCSSSSC